MTLFETELERGRSQRRLEFSRKLVSFFRRGQKIEDKDVENEDFLNLLPIEVEEITGPAEEGVSRTGEGIDEKSSEHEFNEVMHTLGKVMFLTGESPSLLAKHIINRRNEEKETLQFDTKQLFVNKEFLIT